MSLKQMGIGAGIVLLALVVRPVRAEDGRSDLDKAIDLQLTAESLGDLQKVADLCDSALKKGLGKEDTEFANQLLSSVLLRRAEQFVAALVAQQRPNPRWQEIRKAALDDLNRAIKADDSNPQAHLLIAQLNGLPGGDRDTARSAVDRAIELYGDDKEKKSEAFVMRARLGAEPEDQLDSLSKAIELNPTNSQAWELRALLYAARGEFEKAAEDFNKLLAQNEDNVAVRLAVAEAMLNMEKYDEAERHIDRAIEQEPEQAVSYALRARVRIAKDKPQEALADLNEAIKRQPGNPATLLLRAGLKHDLDDIKGARQDVNQVLQAAPGLRQALLLRSMIAATEGKLVDAIADIDSVLKADPKNVELRLQLGVYYSADQRPRRAIEVFSEIIKDVPDDWRPLRSRGDTLLSVGKHKEAIADFDRALQLKPDDSGILNNLAWVLATSPDDDVRNGERAVELAKKACEVTEYKAPHILSTLAGAYAESGDFENARKWSSKAVELGKEQKNEQVEQLQQELESYKNEKPWREKQDVKEKPAPVTTEGKLET